MNSTAETTEPVTAESPPDHMVAITRSEHCKIHRPGDHRVYG